MGTSCLPNYYRRRLWSCRTSFRGEYPHFGVEVLRTANAFKFGLRLNCEQGTVLRFWRTAWIREVPLSYAFHSLFEMASDKDAWVSSQIQDNDWAFTFCHPFSQTRLQMLATLICIFRWHIPRCSKISDWKGEPIHYFHSLFPMSATATFTTIRQSSKEFMDGSNAAQSKDYHMLADRER